MQLEEQKVHVDHLKPGMFVHRLDRDWLGLPFPLEGFMLEEQAEMLTLRKHCDYVYVDILRSRVPVARFDDDPYARDTLSGRVRYENQVEFTDELPEARSTHQRTVALTQQIMDQVRAGGKLDLAGVRSAVSPVVKSVLRHADAYIWVNALKKRDSYEYSHALNNSLLSAAFGRHMGFPEESLISLATGGLLLDIGKTALSNDILRKTEPLTAQEVDTVRTHLTHSLRILDESGMRDPEIVTMVRTHHERYDGSGYPEGLMRNQIPLVGRIAGVVDTFDALTSHRPFRKALSGHQALQQIYKFGDQLFQREIVEQLMQCLSVYPTGSLVEMKSGEVAIVMAQNQARRLKPRVMLLTDSHKQLRSGFVEVDLMTQSAQPPLEIATTLEIGAYGLDPTELYLG